MKTAFLCSVLLLAASFPALGEAASGQAPAIDLDDIKVELKDALTLTEAQLPQVRDPLTSDLVELDETQAHHDAQEEPDPHETTGDLKNVRQDHDERMQAVLTSEHWAAYEELREEILQEVSSEIAALRFIDLKAPLDLTEAQMAARKPVMGRSLREVVGVLFEYGDRRLGVRTTPNLASALNSINARQDEDVATILTPEQIASWEALEERQKAETSAKG